MKPRPVPYLTWSGTIGVYGYCQYPSPAHTLRGEGIACTAQGSPLSVGLSPWESCCGWMLRLMPRFSWVVSLRRAGPGLQVLYFEGGHDIFSCRENRRVFLVNCVNRQSQFVEKHDQKKGHHSTSSLIYGLFLNELFNNSICSHNTH